MKGIILSGGKGTRLFPITLGISKQLMPIYNKPLIYYPLSVLLTAGITDILIITNPDDHNQFYNLLGDGSKIGCSFTYKVQENPNGIAQAFVIGSDFIGNDNVALILGDNIFHGFNKKLIDLYKDINGAIIFAYEVNNPEEYGVVEFDENFNVLSIQEKPKIPKSKYAIPGLYFYDNSVVRKVKKIKPSGRGEYEITDLNKEYLKDKKLKVKILKKGSVWFDCGTFNSYADSCEYVRVIEKRQGKKIACIEEIAFKNGLINKNKLKTLIDTYSNNEYGNYLSKLY